MIDYNELLKLAEAGDEQAQCMVTNCAAQYANATVAAIEMAELLSQEFDIRIKGSSDMSWAIDSTRAGFVKYLGKWVKCKVAWDYCDKGMFAVMTSSGDLLQFGKNPWVDEFKQHVTQKGMAPKMFEAWKLAKNAE